jgi:peptidoglycan hydrolase-like protein with peptidoglycan-binding domain
MRSYLQSGLIPKRGDISPAPIKDLQQDLRQLGYLRRAIDGDFGAGTERAIRSLQQDLLHNDGSGKGDGNAPVSIVGYNQGRVREVNGVLDQALGACLTAMLDDPLFPKLPSDPHPEQANKTALEAVKALPVLQVPIPFLLAVLMQESGLCHFQVPTPDNADNFITVGFDRATEEECVITSRGYGIGQYTLFHHPPRPQEVSEFMLDPVRNVQRAIRELREKFDKFVNGPSDHADDRVAEQGRVSLRICKFAPADSARFLRDCRCCMEEAGKYNITAGQTHFYDGTSDVYEPTPNHHETAYDGVPIRKDIPCDWSYALRRYNGSGIDSYHYQTQVLLRILKG